MLEIQDIFGEQSISVKIGKKEFIDPLIKQLDDLTSSESGHACCWWMR